MYVEDFEQPEDLGVVTIPYKYNKIPTNIVPEQVSKYAGATLQY